MSSGITWHYVPEFIEAPHGKWVAYVSGEYVGAVWSDGDSIFGSWDERKVRKFGSPQLAAQALVRYVEAGGR